MIYLVTITPRATMLLSNDTGIKRSKHETNYPLPSNSKLKNTWSFTSTPYTRIRIPLNSALYNWRHRQYPRVLRVEWLDDDAKDKLVVASFKALSPYPWRDNGKSWASQRQSVFQLRYETEAWCWCMLREDVSHLCRSSNISVTAGSLQRSNRNARCQSQISSPL